MELIVLGSGTCFPDRDRNAAGYIVKFEDDDILLDSGPGTLRRLTEVGVNWLTLRHLCYSHFHLDHCADLFPLIFARKNWYRQQPGPNLHLYGPVGLQSFFRQMVHAWGEQIQTENFKIILTEMEHHAHTFKSWKIQTCPVVHSSAAIAYRIETPDGKSLVYSGDTDESDALIALSQNCDLLVLECSFPEGQKVAGHLTPSSAGKLATAAGCRQLMLTHFYPPMQSAQCVHDCQLYFAGPIVIAEDRLRVTI
ncbi:MBL fold metallo-hydrolase [candidate division KSB1 bacterium]|nr:MBL fold metallo-hydrolase [candidate division KSB1 bacterium]